MDLVVLYLSMAMNLSCNHPSPLEMAAEQTSPTPDHDEQYCSSCGEIIKQDAEICPECGVRHKEPPGTQDETGTDLSMNAYASISLITGAIGFIFFPVIFGPVSAFCGYQVYKYYSEKTGLALIIFGLLSLVWGALYGAMVWSG